MCIFFQRAETTTNEWHRTLFNGTAIVDIPETCLEVITGNPKMACVLFSYFIGLTIGAYYKPDGECVLRIAPEREYESSLVIVQPKGEVGNDAVSDFVLRLNQAGLWNMWIDIDFYQRVHRKVSIKAKEGIVSPEEGMLLRLNHLILVLYLWTILISFSAIAFLAEKVWN